MLGGRQRAGVVREPWLGERRANSTSRLTLEAASRADGQVWLGIGHGSSSMCTCRSRPATRAEPRRRSDDDGAGVVAAAADDDDVDADADADADADDLAAGVPVPPPPKRGWRIGGAALGGGQRGASMPGEWWVWP